MKIALETSSRKYLRFSSSHPRTRLNLRHSCLRGKIEEVTLPVSQVDIIISEWMGYCLLYEAMLDSVIWARDRYLAPNGLMIPSHMTLHVAPFADSDFVTDNVTFWQSVYGFNMTSMLANIHDEVYIHQIKTSSLPAQSSPFLQLPLHFTKQEHLTFAKNPFSFRLTDDIDSLDGFVIWFDAFFQPSREHTVPVSARADHWPGNGVAFTTGPGGLETHWSQGVLLINYGKRQPAQLRKGQTINGTIGYKKRMDNQRQLDIEIKWDIVDSEEGEMQLWSMR